MRCSACGKELHIGVEFCNHCGKPVRVKKTAATTKRSDKIKSSASVRVKYRVSKIKVFFVLVAFFALVALGLYVVEVNRDIEGTWLYVGETDFFSGEEVDKVAIKNKLEKKLVVERPVKIVIDNGTFTFIDSVENLSETSEYTFSGDKIQNQDGTLDLSVSWNYFSPEFQGNLFGNEGHYGEFQRLKVPQLTIKNIVAIVIFFMIVIFLMFVLSIENKKYIIAAPGAGATGRTALAKKTTSGESKLSAPRRMVSREREIGGFREASSLEDDKVFAPKNLYATTAKKSVGLRSTLYTRAGNLDGVSVKSETASSADKFSFDSGLDSGFEKPSVSVVKPSKEKVEYGSGHRRTGGLKITSSDGKPLSASMGTSRKDEAYSGFELSSHKVSEESSDSEKKGSDNWFGSAGDL